jgi:hypothetical protein
MNSINAHRAKSLQGRYKTPVTYVRTPKCANGYIVIYAPLTFLLPWVAFLPWSTHAAIFVSFPAQFTQPPLSSCAHAPSRPFEAVVASGLEKSGMRRRSRRTDIKGARTLASSDSIYITAAVTGLRGTETIEKKTKLGKLKSFSHRGHALFKLRGGGGCSGKKRPLRERKKMHSKLSRTIKEFKATCSSAFQLLSIPIRSQKSWKHNSLCTFQASETEEGIVKEQDPFLPACIGNGLRLPSPHESQSAAAAMFSSAGFRGGTHGMGEPGLWRERRRRDGSGLDGGNDVSLVLTTG